MSTDFLAYGNTSRRCNWYHVFLTKAETNDKKHIKIAVLDHMYICTDGRFRWLKSRWRVLHRCLFKQKILSGSLSWLRPLGIPITSLHFWLGMQRDATLVRSLLLCTHTVLMPRESIYSDLHIWYPDIVMSQLYGKAWCWSSSVEGNLVWSFEVRSETYPVANIIPFPRPITSCRGHDKYLELLYWMTQRNIS